MALQFAFDLSSSAATAAWLAAAVISCGSSSSEPPSMEAGPEVDAPTVLIVSDASVPTMCQPTEASLSATDNRATCVVSRKVSFRADIRPLLTCSGEICHTSFNTPAGWVHVPSAECCSGTSELVVPFHPEASYVLHKLSGLQMCAGNRMPLQSTAFFSDMEIQTIADWICAGALDD